MQLLHFLYLYYKLFLPLFFVLRLHLQLYLRAILVYLYFFISFSKVIWIARLFRHFKLQLKLNRPSGSQVNVCLERKDYIQSYAKEANIKYAEVSHFKPSIILCCKIIQAWWDSHKFNAIEYYYFFVKSNCKYEKKYRRSVFWLAAYSQIGTKKVCITIVLFICGFVLENQINFIYS